MSKGKTKRKGCSKLIWFVISCMVIMAILVAVALSPIFNISQIKVVGNKHYTADRLSEIVNIRVQDNWFLKVAQNTRLSPKNMLLYRYFDAEQNIKQICPYVKDVNVTLSGFGEYTIEVTEREPVAVIAYLASYVVIDDCGVVLDILDNTPNIILPKLNGVALTKINLGEKIYENQDKIEAFCKIYEIIQKSDTSNMKNLYNVIDYIDLSELDDVRIFIDGRILVYLGDIQNISEYKINYMEEIFWNNLTKDEEGVLKFRNNKNPTFTKKTYA